MARPRSQGYDAQREQLLGAAARLFASQGYTATTMQQVAEAAGVGKATLYHYVRDKPALLAAIAGGHVARLVALVDEVAAEAARERLAPEPHLARLIERFLRAYAHAQNEHRVLTEDVKFLPEAEREALLAGQRRVVQAFADAVAAIRPELAPSRLAKPVAMLLFGMINWTFTWLRADGALGHEALAPLVTRLFVGGLQALPEPAGGAFSAPR
ncbi:MAG: TetR/AcrR family transcriptional regulator [Betaproteobacteria bacterium]|nr:TetR/AcrR family transcriptional regulator [Rubrivivax sp.]